VPASYDLLFAVDAGTFVAFIGLLLVRPPAAPGGGGSTDERRLPAGGA
jgi:hypothetical protein